MYNMKNIINAVAHHTNLESKSWAFQVMLVVKNLPANAEDRRNACSMPGWVRGSGEGNGTALQYSSLGNPMGRGAWQATVYEAAECRAQLSN